jgi:hypothetical protein
VSKVTEVRRFEALVIPNDALERGGIEVLRAAIIGSELHVTLRPTFEEPHHWGELLSEVVERIARSYAQNAKMEEQDVVLRIRSAFISDDPAAVRAAQKKSAKKPARNGKKPNKKPNKKRGKKSGKKSGKKR